MTNKAVGLIDGFLAEVLGRPNRTEGSRMSERWLIKNSDFWVKVVEMLQQNWAVIEPEDKEAVRVYFISDTSGVFDEIAFPSASAASDALGRNGFRRFVEASDLHSFLRPPSPPFHCAPHPNGPIYSSGRFWRP